MLLFFYYDDERSVKSPESGLDIRIMKQGLVSFDSLVTGYVFSYSFIFPSLSYTLLFGNTCSREWPKGSICQAMVGWPALPKVSFSFLLEEQRRVCITMRSLAQSI